MWDAGSVDTTAQTHQRGPRQTLWIVKPFTTITAKQKLVDFVMSYSSLDYLPFAVGILNLEGNFIFVNKQMVESFQYPSEKFLQDLSLPDLFPYVLPPELSPLPEQMRYTEYQLRRADGKVSSFGMTLRSLRLSAPNEETGKPFRLMVLQDLTEIERAKREGLMEWLSYAENNVALAFYHIGGVGPETLFELGTEFLKDKDRALVKLGVYTSAAVGQGVNHSTGLFGPLPIPENPNYLGVVYAEQLVDSTQTDPRGKGRRFCFLVVIFPRNLETIFADRRRIRSVMRDQFGTLETLQDVGIPFLEQVRHNLLFFEDIDVPLKERDLERKLNAVFELSRNLAKTNDLYASFSAMADFAEQTLDFRFFVIALVDKLKDELFFVTHRGYDQSILDLSKVRIPVVSPSSIVARSFRTGQTVYVPDVTTSDVYLQGDPSVRSELAVPIISEGDVYGVINVESEAVDGFSDEEDESLLTSLAEQAALVVKHYELQERLRALHDFEHQMALTTDFTSTFEEMADFAAKVLDFTIFSLLVVRSDGRLEFVVHRGYTIDLANLDIRVDSPVYIVSRVARTGEPVYCDDITTVEEYYEADDNVKAQYTLPIVFHNEVLAVINVESASAFTEDEKYLFEVLRDKALLLMRLMRYCPDDY